MGETPLSLCIRTGGADLAKHFVESCVAAKKPFPLAEEILQRICGDAQLYELAIAHGRPNVVAKRFIFNLACATLDRATIDKMLGSGFDINAAISSSSNPVTELVSSRIAWLYKASRWTEFAAGYAHYNGHPDTTSVKVSNNPGPGDLTYGQTLAVHAELNESVRRKELNPKFMSPESRRERLQLLKQFLEIGLDVRKVKQNLNFPPTADVISSNEPDFVVAVTSAGFSLAPDGTMDLERAIQHGYFDMVAPLEQCGHKLKKSGMVAEDVLKKFQQWRSNQDALPRVTIKSPPSLPPVTKPEVSWELYGKSVLSAEVKPDPPRAGKLCTVRLLHDNVYGPCPEFRFDLRIRTRAMHDDEDWQPLKLIGEKVCVDDEYVDVASLDEIPDEETPWVGTFELGVTLSKGKHQVLIRVTAPDPDHSGTLEDWVLDVVG